MMIYKDQAWHLQCDECQTLYTASIAASASPRQRVSAERELRVVACKAGWRRDRVGNHLRHTCAACVARLRSEGVAI